MAGQPDEATLSGDARGVLLVIARHLGAIRPTDTLDDGHRRALLITHVADRCGYRTTLADFVHAEVLAVAPRITAAITRGEYALILRAAAN